MRTLPTLPTLALTALALASGCGGATTKADSPDIGSGKSTLHRSRDCNELTTDLRADTVAKIDKQIDAMVDAVRDCRAALGNDDEMCNYYLGGGYGYATDDMATGGSAPPRSAGDGATGAESGGDNAAPNAPAYSETNTQVQGVDEADVVKTDGQRLFVLHGSTFRILQAYPADTLAELSTTDLEGTPTEMYVENGLAVIFSQVDGAPIYTAAGVTPPNQGTGTGGAEPPIAPDSRGGSGYGGYYGQPLTKITVLRIGADHTTSVAKETYLEGSYLSSRRVGNQVRTVLAGNGAYELTSQLISEAASGFGEQPGDVLAALEQVRAIATAKANQLPLDRWLPRTFAKQGATITAESLACGNAYTPTVGTTQGGLTEVSTLDLADLAKATQQVAIFGQAGTVYGNEGTLYVAASGYTDTPFGGGWATSSVGGGDVASPPPDTATPTDPAPAPGGDAKPLSGNVGLRDTARTVIRRPAIPEMISLNKTHVHKFTFSTEGTPVYEASGTVAGEVKNQFSLDDRGGILRIATTERRMYRSDFEGNGPANDERPRSLTHVFALESADGDLGVKGAVKDLAKDEQIYSVRFVGAKAYVVTFRQVDPLFVLDMANPAAPALLGELKIPGFSNYMQPLDDGHLLTIGQEADDGGRVQGISLQIFDVTNPTAPRRTQQFVYDASTTYGYTEAQYNHKAFTYFADKGLLAFPYSSYDQQTGKQTSTLELFRVSTEGGFSRLGGIDHSAFFTQPQQNACYYVDPTVRRGVFIDDIAYSVSFGGVIAKNVNDLGAAGSTLALPSPYANQPTDCGYGGEDKPGNPEPTE